MEERRSKLPCSFLLWLVACLYVVLHCPTSSTALMYSVSTVHAVLGADGCVQHRARARARSFPAGRCEPRVPFVRYASHCTILYTSASTCLGAKAGIVLKVAGGALESEKTACWLRLRQFNQGACNSDKCKLGVDEGAGAFAATAEREEILCRGQRPLSSQHDCAEMCGL